MLDAASRFRHKVEGVVSECEACMTQLRDKVAPGREPTVPDKVLRGEVRRRVARAMSSASEAVDMLRTGVAPAPIAEPKAEDADVTTNAPDVDAASLEAVVAAAVAKALAGRDKDVAEPAGESQAAREIAADVEPLGAAEIDAGSTHEDIPVPPPCRGE